MPSPIDVLEHNVCQAFENPDGARNEQLLGAIEAGQFDPEIRIDDTEASPRGPRATAGQPPHLVLHQPHLELLWCFCYGWMILYDEGVQRAMLNGTWRGHIVLDTSLKQRAQGLLQWASSLRAQYTTWPNGMPAPSGGNSEEETAWCQRANNVFQSAVAFLLYHELAHILLRHLDAHNPTGTPEAQLATVDMERDADDFAFHVFLADTDGDDKRERLGWAVLASVLSSLYLVDGLVGVYQRRHPHLHHRIAHMISRLQFQQQRLTDYFAFLAACVLTVFSRASRDAQALSLEPDVFDTAEDALHAELDVLDEAIRTQEA
ncbi:MAG: phage exclusion protein Lit family protein [Sulfuricaulis sp.]